MKKIIMIALCMSTVSLTAISAFAGTKQLKINTIQQMYKDSVTISSDGTKDTDDSVLYDYADDGLSYALDLENMSKDPYCATDGLILWMSQDPYLNLKSVKYRVNSKGRVAVTLPQNKYKISFSLRCNSSSCLVTDIFMEGTSFKRLAHNYCR